MMAGIALFLQLLLIFASSCYAEDEMSTTKPESLRAGDTLETAIVLAGVLAATTILVAIVLAPTVIYHTYRSKQEMDETPAPVLH